MNRAMKIPDAALCKILSGQWENPMTYHVKDLEAGPLLDQAVLRALGAVHVQECPEDAPDRLREKWPAHGAFVLTNEDGNSIFYSLRTIPPFSTEWHVGGPLLFERERISVITAADDPVLVPGWWRATTRFRFEGGIDGPDGSSPRPLVAACRALVLAKLGPIVELISGDMVGTPTVTQGPPR